MAKTVVGLFDSYTEAQSVVQDLIDNGFRREDISVVSNDAAHSADRERMGGSDESAAAEGAGTGAVSGTVLGGALGLLVGAGLLAIPGIGPVLAAGPLAAGLGSVAATVGAGALGAGIGAATGGLIGGLVGAGVPKEDAEYYTEGVRRGGTLVTVNAEDTMAGMAHDIMMRHNVVDIDDRSSQWRDSGWTGFNEQTEPLDRSSMATGSTGYPADTMNTRDTTMGTGTSVYPDDTTGIRDTTTGTRDTTMSGGSTMRDTDSMRDTNRMRDDVSMRGNSIDDAERVIPVVEEEIDISKRQVEQGGVRVSSHVEERPVEEQVTLREERVNVERRPVDRPLTDADASAFQETSVEMRESTEEAVVRKRARVVEEVIIDRDVSERTETVRDTVRRTDVDVEQTGTGNMGSGTMSDRDMSSGTMGSGTMSSSSFDTYDNDYRTHYQSTFGSAGYTYDDYKPVYQYGYSLAGDQRYSNRDWADFEGDARTRWEEHNPGTWEQFKDSIRYAWDKARGKR